MRFTLRPLAEVGAVAGREQVPGLQISLGAVEEGPDARGSSSAARSCPDGCAITTVIAVGGHDTAP